MALTAAQIEELKHKNHRFRELVALHGNNPKSVASCDDPDARPGDICLEGACANGRMEVMFCDQNMNCAGSDTVSC
jgi:hypothetical protein